MRSKTKLVEENLVDGMFVAEIKHIRQTCERAGFHTYIAFGAIRAMSVSDARRAFRVRRKTKIITRKKIRHLVLSFLTQSVREPIRVATALCCFHVRSGEEAWDVPVGDVACAVAVAFSRARIRTGGNWLRITTIVAFIFVALCQTRRSDLFRLEMHPVMTVSRVFKAF